MLSGAVVTFSSLLGGLKSLRNSSSSAPHLFYLESIFNLPGAKISVDFWRFVPRRSPSCAPYFRDCNDIVDKTCAARTLSADSQHHIDSITSRNSAGIPF
jgi:hypothetical protein